MNQYEGRPAAINSPVIGNTQAKREVEMQKSMRLALTTQNGRLYTLWLPETMEGRYTFQTHSNLKEDLPLQVEAEEERWFVQVSKGAYVHTGNQQTAERAELVHSGVMEILYQGRQYILFAEAEFEGDRIFCPYYLEERTSYLIGHDPECDIYYENPYVSWHHAMLQWHEDGWYIIDGDANAGKRSTNGTYVNGVSVSTQRLHNGDSIFIMGLYISMGVGFIAMNNANDRVSITTPKIRHIQDVKDVIYPNYQNPSIGMGIFDRKPRKRMRLKPDPIDIDMPPMSMSANKIPLLLRLGSPMVMGGRALATGNILMALTSMVFPAMTQGITEKDRKEYEEKRSTVYRQYLADKEQEILREKQSEEQILNRLYPSTEETLSFAGNKERLWERQRNDEDFLKIRIGSGRLPLVAEINYAEKKFELERDSLVEDMYNLAESTVLLEQAPVMLSLREDWVTGIYGSPAARLALVKRMILQFVLTHSYDECKLVFLAEPEHTAEFGFVRYLPHAWDNERTIRFFATSRADALQIGKYLSDKFSWIVDKEEKNQKTGRKEAYVIFALSKSLFDSVEILKEILAQEEYCGISTVAAFPGVPKECKKIVDLRDRENAAPQIIDLVDPESADQEFYLDNVDWGNAMNSMQELMHTKLMVNSQAFTLPKMVTFLEMFDAGKVEHLNPLTRWAENNPVKSLSAPIGIGTDGKLFTLDLHEKRQGPHGLVAGMTGSGKSEFLITYILSMAVNFSPDEVAFILIDYKGGGLADAFEDKSRGIHLPHLVGTITNLDGASIERSLMSIKSELMRRQTVFKKVKSETNEGTLDIYDYQKLYRAKQVSEPMPHLFIISDEFAELKQQQPEFMDELISAARIGRSLGVHLILATQKPGGVVNNQIWSNTRFRACLRVQDKGDSMEMLKRPEAAELKETGRFYLQVGYNEYFALGQSAWCGADYVPQDGVAEERDDSVQFLDNVGQTVLSVKPKVNRSNSECRQIVAVVQYLSDLAKRENLIPRTLWAEPLPKQLELEEFLRDNPAPDGQEIFATVGLVDDPEHQNQFPLHINLSRLHNMLLIGAAGSGKSTFLMAMLYSLVSRYSPEEVNYYIVDLSNNALSSFREMPHCGAYLTEKENSELGRLMGLMKQITEERKKFFADANVTSFEAYRRLHPMPLILFVFDNFMNLKNLPSGSDLFMQFKDYLREGSSVGIHYVLACNHSNEAGNQSKQELDYRIAIQAKDKYDYSDILEARCKYTPPEANGRGLCLCEGTPLEFHTAMLDCREPGENRGNLLSDRLKRLCANYPGQKAAHCLRMANLEESYRDFCSRFTAERIPIGYSKATMLPVAIPLQQLDCVSLYFGNPKCISPVFSNLLTAAEINRMDVIVMRRSGDSVFDKTTKGNVLSGFTGNCRVLDCTFENAQELQKQLLQECSERNVYRDEYCRNNGMQPQAKRAAKYIRAHSKPILVVFENFNDFCSLEMDEAAVETFKVQFQKTFGYNIYFVAAFYAAETPKNSALLKSFNSREFALLYGGRYDKCTCVPISYELQKVTVVDKDIHNCVMKYNEAFSVLSMPCVEVEEEEDSDEAPII